jgi:hypothetical protein
MIEELVAKMFKSRNAAHLSHWKTKSYAEHKALGSYYDDIIDSLDSFVEAYQGTFGIIGDVPGDTDNIIKLIREDLVYINDNREEICRNVPALENIIDELAGIHMKTLYKLENLR